MGDATISVEQRAALGRIIEGHDSELAAGGGMYTNDEDVDVIRSLVRETFEVVEADPATPRPYYTAALIMGGEPWSFHCAHGHTSPDRARGCLRAVQAAWEAIVADEVVQVEPGLVELRYHQNDSLRAWSRRIRERADWVRVDRFGIRVETPGHAGPDRGTVSP